MISKKYCQVDDMDRGVREGRFNLTSFLQFITMHFSPINRIKQYYKTYHMGLWRELDKLMYINGFKKNT